MYDILPLNINELEKDYTRVFFEKTNPSIELQMKTKRTLDDSTSFRKSLCSYVKAFPIEECIFPLFSPGKILTRSGRGSRVLFRAWYEYRREGKNGQRYLHARAYARTWFLCIE